MKDIVSKQGVSPNLTYYAAGAFEIEKNSARRKTYFKKNNKSIK